MANLPSCIPGSLVRTISGSTSPLGDIHIPQQFLEGVILPVIRAEKSITLRPVKRTLPVRYNVYALMVYNTCCIKNPFIRES